MSQQHYQVLSSHEELQQLVSQVCQLEEDQVRGINDQSRLQSEVIYTLQFNASVNENAEVKKAAIRYINQIAKVQGIRSSSNTEFYDAKSGGEHQFFTVPAINSRMVTFHTVRSALKAVERLHAPHVIFELALSEVGYTAQQKDEYAALVRAAYISLGLTNREIFIQADHYQLDPKKYATDSAKEMQKIKDAIVKAIENEVYNIDIDASKFETADPAKSDRENQMQNALLTAELLAFIRQYEKEHVLPCVLSVGGEVGEVGGENTKYPQVNAFLEIIKEEVAKRGLGNAKGLSKVSINVGSAHGGVLGPDGKPLDTVPLDFPAHHDVYMLGVDPLNVGKHVLSVQHGASTLPKHAFALFPAMHVAEIHLATGFQNIVWEILEKHDPELFGRMKSLVQEKFADKIAEHKTPAVGFAKECKRATEFFKKDLLLSPAIAEIEKELEHEFTTIFHSVYSLLAAKGGTVAAGDRAD